MPSIQEKKRYTYEDYAKLPEGAPYQLIGGDFIMTPSPEPYHQMISIRLATSLTNFVVPRKLGIVLTAPIDVYLEDEETYQPDIIFISKDRMDIIGGKKIEGSPDFVIEILSPSTAYYDLRKKFKMYEKHGVREYWIVDPSIKSVDIYNNKDGKFFLAQSLTSEGKCTSSVIKGFEVDVKDIFGNTIL